MFTATLTEMQRLAEYAPIAEGILAREFAARARDRLDSWHLFAIAVDPSQQGSDVMLRNN